MSKKFTLTAISLTILFTIISSTTNAFPIPHSGQAKCYDDAGNELNPCPSPGEPFYGQDGNYIINPRSYTKLDVNGNDLPITATNWVMVRDNVTGLIWEVKTDDGSVNDKDNEYTWEDTENVFITELNTNIFGGHSDWRMPTVQELASITNRGIYNPAIDAAYFPNVRSYYWSGTTNANNTDSAWVIDFNYGFAHYNYKSSSYYVRAVRAGQSDIVSFDNLVINGDGTLTDKHTNLMWQQVSTEEEMSWGEALQYCETLSLAGYNDWRLPSVMELRNIVDYNRYDPPIDTNILYDRILYDYWSSTTSAYGTDYAWVIGFYAGYDYNDSKNSSYYVRAVRAGHSNVELLDNLVISITANMETGTAPLDVEFTATATGGTAPYNFEWDFGDGYTGTGEKVSNTYSTEGKHSIIVTVTDSEGKTASKTLEITVEEEEITYPENDNTVEVWKFISGDGDSLEVTVTKNDKGEFLSGAAQGIDGCGFLFCGGWVNEFSVTENNVSIRMEAGGDYSHYAELNGLYADGKITDGIFTNKIINNTTKEETIRTGVYNAVRESVTFIPVDNPPDPPVIEIDLTRMEIAPYRTILTMPDSEIRFLVKGYLSSGEIIAPQEIEWISSDINVVKMVDDRAIAVSEGEAVITATSGDISAQVYVTVKFQAISVEASPVLIFLETGKSFTPTVTLIYPDGNRKDITSTPDYTLKKVIGDSVTVDGTTVSAQTAGVSRFEVVSGSLSASFQVNVTEPVPLNISPASVRVKPGERIVVEIDGGEPPYTPSGGVDFKSGIVEIISGRYFWNIDVPARGGENQFVLQDALGSEALLSIMVLAPLVIEKEPGTCYTQVQYRNSVDQDDRSSANQVNRNAVNQFILKAAGGTPPFEWYSSSGSINTAPDPNSSDDPTSRIIFTPPSKAGIYTVSVVDSGGQTQNFRISTFLKLDVTPQQLFLAPSEQKDFSIIGGQPPFTAVADAGSVTAPAISAGLSTVSYTAPARVGEYMVTIMDNKGDAMRLYVTVTLDLAVSPSKAYLDKEESKTFHIAGGIGRDKDFFIKALKGDVDVHPENMKFSYAAPNINGRDVITITDMSGAQAEVEVEVVPSYFFITPQSTTLLREETRRFKSVGGTGEGLVWSAEQGDISQGEGNQGDISRNNEPSVEYVAPHIRTRLTLNVKDSLGTSADADIHVISDKVLITPSTAYLKPGESTTFRGVFGTEDYTYTWTMGDGKTVESPGSPASFTYTAPSAAGIHSITVFDSAGNSATAQAFVSGGSKRKKVTKGALFKIKSPSAHPNSESQPVGVGPVQDGESRFEMAFDFPNYEDKDGASVPMNFYVGAYIPEWNFLGLFDDKGGIFDLNNEIIPCMIKMVDAVYTEGLSFEYCNPDAPLKVDMYVLAIESGYDVDASLSFDPPDAPYELWHYSFSFPKCP
ncbi:MAG: DUF1566 domain-containing protein [Desulfamplus sp.]|nr:DUF1566 domain-containing protein [Desulfamplus sp.]